MDNMAPSFWFSFTFFLVYCFLQIAAETTIATFTDSECQKSWRSLQGPNGYPNGTCTSLKSLGQFGSFQVVGMDPGCTVTIYGKDTTTDICSSSVIQFANVATCYNTSWFYYSIDACTPPSQLTSSSGNSNTNTLLLATSSATSSSIIPTTTAPGFNPIPTIPIVTQTPSPSSSHHTGATIGGVIGGVAFGCTAITIILYLLYRKYWKGPPAPPPKPHRRRMELPDGHELHEISPGRPRFELMPRSIYSRSESAGTHPMMHGHNDNKTQHQQQTEPAELPSGIEDTLHSASVSDHSDLYSIGTFTFPSPPTHFSPRTPRTSSSAHDSMSPQAQKLPLIITDAHPPSYHGHTPSPHPNSAPSIIDPWAHPAYRNYRPTRLESLPENSVMQTPDEAYGNERLGSVPMQRSRGEYGRSDMDRLQVPEDAVLSPVEKRGSLLKRESAQGWPDQSQLPWDWYYRDGAYRKYVEDLYEREKEKERNMRRQQ